MSETRHFLVSGRVQGVGFRAATRERARKLTLDGWVRNRPDGCVELIAHGSSENLAALRNWLGQGPLAARVTKVAETPADDTGLPSPFSIV